MSESLQRMTEALRPLCFYDLRPGSFVYGELTVYSLWLDQMDRMVDSLITEGFVQTATEAGLSRWEALMGSRQREGADYEKRREMLVCQLRRSPDGFTPAKMREALGAVGLNASLTENFAQEQIILEDETAIEDVEQYLRIRRAAREILPAHLEIFFAMGSFSWQIFDQKGFTWEGWDGLDMNWMAYEIYH